MKSRYFKVAICIVIFLSLIGISNLLLRPIYNKIGKEFEEFAASVSQKIQDEAGLKISYGSLSPSILRGITLNDVVLIDSESQLPLATIRSLSLAYSFSDLFSGGAVEAFKSLSLHDVEIEIIEDQNDFWLKKITRYKETPDGSLRILELLEKLDISILKDVRIYRLKALYRKSKTLFEANVNKATFVSSKKGITDAKVGGNFSIDGGSQKITGDLNFSAVLPKGFEGSSAVLRFANVSSMGYRARYLGFIAEYKNKNFNLRMLPSAQSVYLEFNAALDTGDLNAKFFADNFNIARFLQTTNQTQFNQSLFAMNFSLDAETHYNVNTKEFSYNSKGDVFIPAHAIPQEEYAEDILVSYSLYGNENKINITHFQSSSERYNFSFDGNYNFNTKRPEGNLYVDSFVISNGGTISAEVYIEPTRSGFMCFSPQLNLGDRTLTAAQLNVIQASDSFDFTFEVSDYSHLEAETPGVLSLFGSFAPSTGVLQAALNFDTIYLDTLVLVYAFFADTSMQPLLEKAAVVASPFVFTCDSFASGVGSDFAFNIPYAFIANTMRDDQMLMLSADGNKENIHLSRLEFAFAKQRIVMNADSTLLEDGESNVMSGRLELNEIPYDFTGFFNENWMSITSEYGFQFMLSTDTSGEEVVLSGLFSTEGFPFKLGNLTYSLSNEISFSYTVSNGINISIPRFEGRIIEGSFLNPVLSLSATMDSQGLNIDNISYTDKVSSLAGSGTAFWFATDGILEDANFSFNLSNLSGIEKITLAGNVLNPMQTELSMGTLLSGEFIKNLLITANFEIDSLRSQRFVQTSRESDSVSATLSIQGMLNNPFVTFEIPRAVFTVQNTPLVLTAKALFEDMVLTVQDLSLDFGATQIKKLTASFDTKKFAGDMNFDFETRIFNKKIATDVVAKLESLSESETGIPEVLNLTFDTSDVIENNIKRNAPYHLGITKMQDEILITSSDNIGLSGAISNYHDVNLKIDNPLPFYVSIEGTVSRDEINLLFSDVSINLSKLLKSVGAKIVNVQKGIITGGFAITGSPTNPFFSGALDIIPAEFNFPDFFKKHATTDKVTLIMSGSQFYTEPTRCRLHRTPVDVTVNVQMNRLAFESLDVHVQTVEDNFAPLNMNLNEIHVKGDFMVNLDINYENAKVSVSGDLTAKNTNAEFGATRLNEILAGFISNPQDDERATGVDAALSIKVLSRVQIAYSSFLRAVVVPGSEIEVMYFGDQGRLLLNGDVPVKSGEISYINTNFYIKEGSIHFSDNDESFDPRVTVRAETKTRDENNENITVYLRVDNQHLSELSPRLSASPAKSEREIMEILGTIITAEAENAASFALATGDYTIQTVFTRKLENALRDFFNFDIFSLRTMVVQNAVKQGIDRGSSGESNNSNPAGNYLDGTTVYIGKYLGDSLFADAMLRLDYDENRVGDEYTLNGLSFRPEIGFELEAPFAKIRWSMSPDFEDLMNLNLVQNTALTLSWKFNF